MYGGHYVLQPLSSSFGGKIPIIKYMYLFKAATSLASGHCPRVTI